MSPVGWRLQAQPFRPCTASLRWPRLTPKGVPRKACARLRGPRSGLPARQGTVLSASEAHAMLHRVQTSQAQKGTTCWGKTSTARAPLGAQLATPTKGGDEKGAGGRAWLALSCAKQPKCKGRRQTGQGKDCSLASPLVKLAGIWRGHTAGGRSPCFLLQFILPVAIVLLFFLPRTPATACVY